VYSLEMARIYTYLLQQSGKKFAIIHSLDGYDEISLTNDTKIITESGEKIYTAEELGKRTVRPEDIMAGNSVKEAADIFLKILDRKGTWSQNAVVIANAAMALFSMGNYSSYNDAYYAAVESLESGKAKECFQKLISLQ
jgi:anthranilate phosphoribosyltransferase